MEETLNKYNENDVVLATFENGDQLTVKLGKPRKLVDVDNVFLDWSYDSKTEGVNWIAECWIDKKI